MIRVCAEPEASALAYAQQALLGVGVSLPHLSGLARVVTLETSRDLATIGITETGRLIFNAVWLRSLPLPEASFVMAHELMHLALGTHSRGQGLNRTMVNVLHDWIINDILSEELGMTPPAGGLQRPGARHASLESLVLEYRDIEGRWRMSCSLRLVLGGLSLNHPFQCAWDGLGQPGPSHRTALAEAFGRAGFPSGSAVDVPIDIHTVAPTFDVLDDAWVAPGCSAIWDATRSEQRVRVIRAVAASEAQQILSAQMQRLVRNHFAPCEAAECEQAAVPLRAGVPAPRWESALQRWFDSLAPTLRCFSRPSRRAGDRADLVLPGRSRDGWTLHVVLDSSGSMETAMPEILGKLASFAESSGVVQIHVLQCDTGVRVDEYIPPEALKDYRVEGYGGSDLSPALRLLAEDIEVEAVLVLTDGWIEYPEECPPYRVLWAVIDDEEFAPAYGEILRLVV